MVAPAPRALACGGVSVEVELYALSPSALGTLLTQIMPPLSLGWISLADGRQVHGFLCESYATEEASDISKYGPGRTTSSHQSARPITEAPIPPERTEPMATASRAPWHQEIRAGISTGNPADAVHDWRLVLSAGSGRSGRSGPEGRGVAGHPVSETS
ncbi:allophanate hydrolase-related protein [Sphaerisporangium viridialbum]|uniref:allophanate hydrolase-related protein n=1 Tax=Sphaerisporangium viridialbum TaxID=46189 RepID=UPI003C72D233